MSREEATNTPPLPPPPPPPSTSSSESTTGTEKDAPIREEIVENAVNFLRNPNVAGTPLARRVAFMKRKGMTSKEIDTALARAAAAGGASGAPSGPVPPTLPPRAQMYGGVQQPMPPPQQPLMMPPQQNGVGWVPLIGASMLAAGLGVGASYLVSKYVIPWWKGDSKKGKEKKEEEGEKEGEEDAEDKELKEMLKSIDENQKNMIKSINELSQAIRDQSN